jgi:hypothetical protein
VTRQILKIKHEETYSKLLIVRTKGYAGFFSRYKGQSVPEGREVLDLKGLEAVKGSTIKIARDLQNEVVLRILRGDAPGDVRAMVEHQCRQFEEGNFELDDLLFWTKVTKQIKEYRSEPPHVRIAREYEAIGREFDGGKVCYWFAHGEQPRLADEWDPSQVDRDWYWSKHVWPPTQRVLEAAWFEQDWNIGIGARQVKLFNAPRKRRRKIVEEVPDRIEVRIKVPPLDERTHATQIRDRIRIRKVRQAAAENPGPSQLIIVMVAGKIETRLETSITIDPLARERIYQAGIIPPENRTLFEEDEAEREGNDGTQATHSSRGTDRLPN